jgi:DNA-binding transcriptional ArsR family regulator
MAAPLENETFSRLLELVTQLLREKEDSKDLLSAFSRGDLSSEQIVNALAARYQTGIGGAVRALAEHNKDAAQQLGERLRNRLDGFLAELAAGENAPATKPLRASVYDGFKDRDDSVLRREYVMMKLLASSNDAMRSASIFETVKAVDVDVQDEAITAHLSRLVKAGLIGRERKGRYHGLPHGISHVAALVSEIEARGLKVPK